MINFTLRVSIDFTNLLKSVNLGCFNTQNTYTRHIANHSCVVLLFGKNTLKHGANHSSAILLWGFE